MQFSEGKNQEVNSAMESQTSCREIVRLKLDFFATRGYFNLLLVCV